MHSFALNPENIYRVLSEISGGLPCGSPLPDMEPEMPGRFGLLASRIYSKIAYEPYYEDSSVNQKLGVSAKK